MNLKDKKVAILGWGVDTQDIFPWLEKQGAKVTVFDEATGNKFDHLDNFDLIVRSPGVYRFRPEIVAAEKAGVEVTSKTKLFFDFCPAKIIGVTGTKGKGTTATLIFEILQAAGEKVYLGGNIGSGVFGILDKLGKVDWVVLELSSFQLIDLHKSPHIAVILMVTSEHLDWHPTTQQYLEAKSQIVRHQKSGDFVVANKDYPASVRIAELTEGKKIWVSGKDADQIPTRLKGQHNKENVAAAIAVAKVVGVSDLIIGDVVAKFAGLEHRLEEVATISGVTYYNDSFSTTPETAIAAIKAFVEPEIVVLGGSSKNSDFAPLVKTIRETQNIKTLILIGVEGKRLLELLSKVKALKILTGAKNMAEIVKMAYNNATSGDVVLLSPACASFDMFKNYKDRGNQFKQEVQKLGK